MSTTRRQCILFLICLLLAAFCLSPAVEAKARDTTHGGQYLEMRRKIMMIKRRVGIGSMAPTCTYNECRGCKYKCRAEQIPVDGNDPINSPYHYKCVCHRS